MESLNDDIIKEIIFLLDVDYIKNFSSTNRHIFKLSGNNDIWINKFNEINYQLLHLVIIILKIGLKNIIILKLPCKNYMN
jgi:hypothetical protein